ncbi:zinc finger MYM-type protein 1-like [Ambystoma mexicanum]|uniref:zinc finger MYM-type protein 1-like n=1 Tax=Ambystoma mexicanum TaxID=8296 RepID=UPI0037E74D29
MASKVLENILMRLGKAKFYSVIMDCTSDISHIEQMSLTVRFVDDSEGQIKVKEHFVCFKPVDDSTGKGLTELFINILNENKIMLEHCRGQGYDNGANMKGKHSGFQARILALNPRAFVVPCGCHSLNLVVSDAALSSLDSVTLFGLLQRIYTLFSASTIRWKVLTNNVRNLTVKPLSDTRWESRIDSVKAVRFQVTDIYDTLMELAQLSKADAGVRHEAQSLANQITDFKFLVSLVVWHDILFQINIVSKPLQNKSVDIVTATSLMKGCIQFFVAYRDNGFENAIIAAKEMAADLGVEPSFKEIRIRQRKRQFDYEGRDYLTQTQSPEEKFKRELFYVLVDTAHGSIEERFGQMKDHEQCWGFLYDLSKLPMDKKTLLEHCTNLHQSLKHGESSDINGMDLHVELENIRYMLPRGTVTPLPVLQYIHDANLKNIFPNVWISLKILLTLPVTVASGERSFSKLKLIKTYLRSTMANERLTSLAILSIENDIGQSLDLSDAVLQFARAKSRKVTF